MITCTRLCRTACYYLLAKSWPWTNQITSNYKDGVSFDVVSCQKTNKQIIPDCSVVFCYPVLPLTDWKILAFWLHFIETNVIFFRFFTDFHIKFVQKTFLKIISKVNTVNPLFYLITDQVPNPIFQFGTSTTLKAMIFQWVKDFLELNHFLFHPRFIGGLSILGLSIKISENSNTDRVFTLSIFQPKCLEVQAQDTTVTLLYSPQRDVCIKLVRSFKLTIRLWFLIFL